MLSDQSLKSRDNFASTQGSVAIMTPPLETALCGMGRKRVSSLDSLLECVHLACKSCFEQKDNIMLEDRLERKICADIDSPKAKHDSCNKHELPTSSPVASSKVDALLRNLRKNAADSTHSPIKR